MAAGAEKKKKCQTIIPKDWPRFTGPAYTTGMQIGEANRLAGKFRREVANLSPTQKVFRKAEDR